jgi:hypothetical protein
MRAYPLRLPDELADTARQQAERLGISFNAFVAVALDAYLRGAATAPNKSSSRPAKPKPASKARAPKPEQPAQPKAARRPDRWHSDPSNWRNFHEPDVWPWVDPEWTPPPGISNPWAAPGITDPEDVKPADIRAFEAAYWQAHAKPDRPWFESGEVPY